MWGVIVEAADRPLQVIHDQYVVGDLFQLAGMPLPA